MRPRCPSVGPEGYRCRKRLHPPVPAEPLPPLEVCHTAHGWQGSMYWDDETAAESRIRQTVSLGDNAVVWDVARLIEQTAGMTPDLVMVRMYVDPDAVNLTHWRTVDVHTPIILAPHPDTGWTVCLDGRHRLYKARRIGREVIPAYRLTAEQERAARLTPDEAAEVDRAHEKQQAFLDTLRRQ